MKKNAAKLKPAPVLKDYWCDNSRFSDLFNQVFFNGKEIIKPDKLSEQDTDESAMLKVNHRTTDITRARDIIKQYEDGAELVLIGLESQMSIHYAMPVRTALYDSLRYTHQCKELEKKNRAEKKLIGSDEFLSGIAKSDRIKPVITLVIYYGEKEWDGPIYLSDMMDIPPQFKEIYNDQRIHLLQVRTAGQYQFKNQDNHDLFTVLGEYYTNGALDLKTFKEKYPDLTMYWETLAAIGAITGSMDLIEYAHEHKEGGELHMWTALENFKKEGEAIGEAKGETKKIVENVFKKIEKKNTVEEIAEMLEEDISYIQKIIDIKETYPEYSVLEITVKLL